MIKKVGRGFAYRFYNLYVKGSNLFGVLDVKLGRQNIFAGTGKGTLDGLNLKVKAGKTKNTSSMYMGVPSLHIHMNSKITPKLKIIIISGQCSVIMV